MYQEPVIQRRLVIHRLLDTVFSKPTRSDVVFYKLLKPFASSVARQFEFPDEIGMYREPVNQRRLVIRRLLDTVFTKPTRSDGMFTQYQSCIVNLNVSSSVFRSVA